MFPDQFYEMAKNECTISISTNGMNGLHTKNIWSIHMRIPDDSSILLPLEDYSTTERNIILNNTVKLSVRGENSQEHAIGYLMKGTAHFYLNGPELDEIKSEYPWASRVLQVKVSSIKQLL